MCHTACQGYVRKYSINKNITVSYLLLLHDIITHLLKNTVWFGKGVPNFLPGANAIQPITGQGYHYIYYSSCMCGCLATVLESVLAQQRMATNNETVDIILCCVTVSNLHDCAMRLKCSTSGKRFLPKSVHIYIWTLYSHHYHRITSTYAVEDRTKFVLSFLSSLHI